MARARDARWDFRAGLNLSFSQDALDRGELRRARNAVLSEYGGIQKRPGSQRIHATQIASGAPVLGLFQWFPSSGRETVAIAGGKLYHKKNDDADFTEVALEEGSFSTTVRPAFAVHINEGTPILYISDGTLRTWNGTAIAEVDEAPNAIRIKVYKTRMFATDLSKTINWARVSNPADWSFEFGGSAPIETYSAEGLVALETVGSSLLLFKENSIARFRGVSSDEIRIDQETEGVSPDIGTIAPGTVNRVEGAVPFLSDRGPYLANESGLEAIGVKVEPAFGSANQSYLPYAVSVHHKAARRMYFFIPEAGKTANNVGYAWDYRLKSWTGPFEFGGQFDVCSAAEYELDDRTESMIVGGYDGWVRRLEVPEVGGWDDVLYDGTGGVPVVLDVLLPDIFFGDPAVFKLLHAPSHISADLGATGHLVVRASGDGYGERIVNVPTKGAGVRPYIVRPGARGRRINLRLTDETAELVKLNGLILAATMGGRQV